MRQRDFRSLVQSIRPKWDAFAFKPAYHARRTYSEIRQLNANLAKRLNRPSNPKKILAAKTGLSILSDAALKFYRGHNHLNILAKQGSSQAANETPLGARHCSEKPFAGTLAPPKS